MAMTAAANSTMDRKDSPTTNRMSPNVIHSDNTNSKKPSGIILKGGRVRLPDKLMEYLNKEVAPQVLYWQTGGESFSFDSKTAQTELLDKYFNGTKLSSFTRSLNRWGFKRIFHALLPKHVLSYEHPCFKKSNPDMVKDMKMADAHEETHGNNQTNSNGNAGGGKSKNSKQHQGQEDQSSQRSASDRAEAAALQGNPANILSSTAVNGVLSQVPSFSQAPNGPAVALILNGLSNAGGAAGGGAAAVAGISPALLQSIAAAHAQAAAAQAAAAVASANSVASNVTSPALTSQNVAAAAAAAPGAGSCLGDIVRSFVAAQHPATTNPSAPTATATVSPEMAQRLAIQALIASQQQRTVQQTLSFGQQQQQQQGQDQQQPPQQQVDIQRLLLAAFLNPPQPQSLPLTTLKSLFCQSSGIGGANCQIQPQLEILAAQAQQASASSVAIQQALQSAGDAQNQQRQAALQLLLSLLAQQQQNEGSHQHQQQNNSNSNHQNSN